LIDLHCHLLPGIDDGPTDLNASLAMARMAVADGITVTACTPHILPGLYNNAGPQIRQALESFRAALARAEIPLRLCTGADVHVSPDLKEGLKSGRVLTLNDTRYFLFEPPHHVPSPQLEALAFGLQAAGYVPVLTHPERLSWIESYYEIFERMAERGVWMQLTAGSLVGRFGRRPRYWAERMLDEGLCHIIATDAHDPVKRVPLLAEARDAAARRVGEDEATNLVETRPRGILEDKAPNLLLAAVVPAAAEDERARWWHFRKREARP
jgi:protein-tyrosine phosphatase